MPNLLCLSRIALSPVLAHLIVAGRHEAAFAVFLYAGLSDLVRRNAISCLNLYIICYIY